ncbi:MULTISPECIES: GNAT family N-acetyltransferase [unclassified Streptomyces]|uniref:GNAT family N-acetyltransferase n=1 Tax=unclassified Streptomyces TaxID=2593676 RepID=UPI00074A04CC|nr:MULTISPECIES: GNAT family protein [unclassified Streptomyces]KUL54374.1 GCN5 family acetyltransferase [Streptomyces sp. NRRL S-1521]THC49313.1 N-acetyltransferase [Streptomyces sp. A1499]
MFAISLGDEDDAELRPLEPWQAEEFLAHMDRGRDYIGRYVGLPDVTNDLAATRKWLQVFADKAAADTGRLYGIWLDDRLVGGVMFRVFDSANGTCEAGCWLEPGASGRGLVTRAVRVLIDWAFDTRGMHRVEWHVASKNRPSVNVAKRLGMTRDGVLRGNDLYKGVRQDTEIWSVLAEEWRGGRGGEG